MATPGGSTTALAVAGSAMWGGRPRPCRLAPLSAAAATPSRSPRSRQDSASLAAAYCTPALPGSTKPEGRATLMLHPISCTWPLSASAALAMSGVRNSTNAYLPSVCMLTLITGSMPAVSMPENCTASALLNSVRSASLDTTPGMRPPTYTSRCVFEVAVAADLACCSSTMTRACSCCSCHCRICACGSAVTWKPAAVTFWR
mmetsp:Transcript_25718/g.65375  ORF Transcript_25718/g.65375 Transcript_25718/m.65375 type:complete len:202 (+) Transcript_25718:924-1529(+)